MNAGIEARSKEIEKKWDRVTAVLETHFAIEVCAAALARATLPVLYPMHGAGPRGFKNTGRGLRAHPHRQERQTNCTEESCRRNLCARRHHEAGACIQSVGLRCSVRELQGSYRC